MYTYIVVRVPGSGGSGASLPVLGMPPLNMSENRLASDS